MLKFVFLDVYKDIVSGNKIYARETSNGRKAAISKDFSPHAINLWPSCRAENPAKILR